MSQTVPEKTDRVSISEFTRWAEAQIEKSRCMTARIIMANDGRVKFRIRENSRYVEDIILIKGKEADTIRFERNGRTRQFHSHRRNITFHDKTLIVRTNNGKEICRAGTGTKQSKGPFPVN